ncbi:hypothetical protein FD754_007190 [Muntiacus muntjak]|uniref:Uncharacterized protein n=1 Tax=Muntiacus muntjak TaxID=9888 RepID=A0A5N3WNG9_MUNMU|nr:hypothetical protein FD754_007190 [Muntiacus muntjak]
MEADAVENAGTAGPSRFGLKRAEALGHKTPEPAPRRTEITIVKPQESAHRRMETPASKITRPDVSAAEQAGAQAPAPRGRDPTQEPRGLY